MRIALVCPTFPPDHCGVGDYSSRLALELAAEGNEVAAWTAQMAPSAGAASAKGIQVASVAMPWNRSSLREIGASLARWRPEAVLIQYTPYLYGRRSRGLAPGLPWWISRLRSKLGCPVAVTAHELHYPMGLTPDRLLVGTPQWLQFLAVLSAADLVLFTYEVPYLRYSKAVPWRSSRMAWVPVGANVAPELVARGGRPVLPSDEHALLQAAGVPERHRVLLQFGSAHPSVLPGHSFAALEAARRKLGPDSTTLVFLGLPPEAVERSLREAGRMDLKPWVRGLGYLADWQASLWIRRADLMIAPFVDGVSTRRTSVMAGLAHSRAMLTTRGMHTERSLDWARFAAVTPAEDTGAFAREAATLLTDPALRQDLALAGKRAYDERFSWPIIAKQVIAALRSARG